MMLTPFEETLVIVSVCFAVGFVTGRWLIKRRYARGIADAIRLGALDYRPVSKLGPLS